MFTRPLPTPNDRTAPSVDPCLPEKIGGFEVLRRVARGGMGEILEARDSRSGLRVALKVLSFEGHAKGSRTRLRRRFAEEIAITRELEGPGIPTVLAEGETVDGRPYFAMPFLEGETLTEFLQRGDDPSQALTVLDDVCSILQRAHERGIVHRDLKPDNVLVAPNGLTYLIDWGLAVRAGTQGSSGGSPEGTVGFMPPEQVAGDRASQDSRSDVYGLGSLLYTILGKRRPFADLVEGNDSGRLLWHVRHADPAPLRNVSSPLRPLVSVCERALSRDVARRHRDAEEFRLALRAARDRFLPLRWSRACWGRMQKHRGMTGTAIALLVGLVLALSAWLWSSSASRNSHLVDAEIAIDQPSPLQVPRTSPTPPVTPTLLRFLNELDGPPVERSLLRLRLLEDGGVVFATCTPLEPPPGGRITVKVLREACAPRVLCVES